MERTKAGNAFAGICFCAAMKPVRSIMQGSGQRKKPGAMDEDILEPK